MLKKSLLDMKLEDIKTGYLFNSDKGVYECLICGEIFEAGEIYPISGRFFDVHKAVAFHIKEKHSSMLELLFELDKKYTGITENQKSLLTDFYNGLSDSEIAKKNGVAAATIRHQRFVFREKAKQAKAYLAIFELVENSTKRQQKENLVELHNGAKMVDDRYELTYGEQEKIIDTYFDNSESLKLKSFPTKEKRKIVVLRKISSLFEMNKKYSEKEINIILKTVYSDIATIRRYLIEYGFMERAADCSQYWLKS